MLFLFLPCCVGLMLTADDLMVVMFGESFAPAGETLRIAALLTLALGFSNLFGTQVLLTFGEEKKLLFCTIVGAVSNVCLNFSMIPRFAQNGAAAASVISEALVTVCCVCFSVKHIQVRLRRGYLAKTVIAVAFMGALTWIVMSMVNGEFLRLAATVGEKNNDLRIMSGGCKDRRNRTSASACKDPDGCESSCRNCLY